MPRAHHGTMPLGPTWKIGEVTVTSIIEDEQHWKFRWLLPEVDEELIATIDWLRPNFIDEDGRLILRIQALVIESHDTTIVIDPCVGNDKPRPTPMFNELQTSFMDDFREAGFDPETVDIVTCTHLHVDHVGWNTHLVDGVWVPTFPNARYLFGKEEYAYWREAGPAEVDFYGDVMGDSVTPIFDAGLADLIDSDHELTPEVRLEPTPGHTPGHNSVRISSNGHEAVITGDMIHHPIQFPRPDIACSADTDSDQAIVSRRESFARWHDDGALIIGTHFAGPGSGTLRQEDDAWRFVF